MTDFHTDETFSTRENLLEWVQNVALSLGYVVVIKRTNKKPSGYVPKLYLMCDRGGIYKGTSTRDTGTRKINCPFELIAIYYKTYDIWKLTVKNDEHNHEPAMYMEGHPYVQRLTKKESEMVKEMTTNNVPPRDILSSLKRWNENNVSSLKTIYNERNKIRTVDHAGRSQMQVVFEILHSKGYVYEYRTNDTTNELEDLFFVHPTSLKIWHAFPQVLMMDATYKTNKYNMLFLEIVGVTSTTTTFSIGFGFMDQEKEANYVWALNCLKDILGGYDQPSVIVTDRELALMNACAKVFPSAVQLLCRWHISQSIMTHCRRRYKSEQEWNSFMKDWETLIDSSTWELYVTNYAHLESRLTYNSGVLDYLNRVWLDKYKEMFVSLWIDRVLNFNNNTNNRVESQHAKLKKYLDSQHANLDRFFIKIEEMVESQHIKIKENFEKNKTKLRHLDNIPLFKKLGRYVSHHALEKLRQELDRLVGNRINEGNCGCKLRHSCGLPCAHEIAIYSNAYQPIPLESIDKFWRKLDLTSDFVTTEDDTFDCEDVIESLKESYNKQSIEGKKSYLRKIRDIFSPSTNKIVDPVVRKNTRGRPRLSKQQTKSVPHPTPTPHYPTQPSQTQDPRRRSFSTYTPDYMSGNFVDLNQEPERHSTYSFREPSMSNSFFNQEQPIYNSNPLMNEIPEEFHQYVRHIENVIGDGNCGFRSIAVSLGRGEGYWRQIRSDLYNELLAHPGEYAMIYCEFLNRISHSLNFFGSGFASSEYWMIMPDTAILIANKYGVIVHYLNKAGSSTWFPLRYGPQDIPNPASIVIAHVHGNHYVMVDLQGPYPMPPVLSRLVRSYRSEHSVAWETLYSARLNAYNPPNATENNCNIDDPVYVTDDE